MINHCRCLEGRIARIFMPSFVFLGYFALHSRLISYEIIFQINLFYRAIQRDILGCNSSFLLVLHSPQSHSNSDVRLVACIAPYVEVLLWNDESELFDDFQLTTISTLVNIDRFLAVLMAASVSCGEHRPFAEHRRELLEECDITPKWRETSEIRNGDKFRIRQSGILTQN